MADTLQRNIFQVSTATGELRAILPLANRLPMAIDFDFIHKYVYWIDNGTNAIGKVSLDGRLNGYIYQYTSRKHHTRIRKVIHETCETFVRVHMIQMGARRYCLGRSKIY